MHTSRSSGKKPSPFPESQKGVSHVPASSARTENPATAVEVTQQCRSLCKHIANPEASHRGHWARVRLKLHFKLPENRTNPAVASLVDKLFHRR